MNEALIKVDYQDREVGTGSKMDMHCTPILHRAFSVFIYHGNQMFIHRRNINKYHSGGLWTNACCSHMREGVDELSCVKERLFEELGIEKTPTFITKFVYFHKFHDDLYEFEYDHIYLLDYYGEFNICADEIEEVAWVDINDLSVDIAVNPLKYSVWFITAFGFIYNYLLDVIGN